MPRTWLLCRLGYHSFKVTPLSNGLFRVQCQRCRMGWAKLSREEAKTKVGRLFEPPVRDIPSPSIDIGCGFTDGVQQPVYATVSLDLNMGRVEAPLLMRLRSHDSHPLGADACHLPIRSGCMREVHWRAVLEHLPDPGGAILEGKRTMRQGATAKIVLPIITSHMRHYLLVLFTQFPFSLFAIVNALYKAHLYWHLPGVPHIRDVRPEHLKAYFNEVETQAYYRGHKWFRGPWSRITKLLTNGRFIPDIQGQYLIRCR